MYFSTKRVSFAAAVDRPDQDDVLGLLERFAEGLHGCDDTAAQVRLVLQAVRDTARADAVYWDPGSSGETVEVVGDYRLTPAWCREFTTKLLQATPGVDGQLLRTSLTRLCLGAPLVPQSAAMVRVSKSKASWIVAVSFTPGRAFRPGDVKAMSLARRLLLSQRQTTRVHGKLKQALVWSIHCLTALIDAKVPGAIGHSERVGQLAARLGHEMNLGAAAVSELYFAGLLHDLGKIGVPDGVLQKRGPLTEEERARLREYPAIGDRILADVRQLEHLRPAVRGHRERFDGTGYPDGLRGDAIPLPARVLALAEAADAMLSPRPHRPPLTTASVETALAEGTGSLWDPRVVEPFLDCRKDLYAICQSGTEHSLSQAVERAANSWKEDSFDNIQLPPSTVDAPAAATKNEPNRAARR